MFSKILAVSIMMLSVSSADTIYFNNGAELDGTILECTGAKVGLGAAVLTRGQATGVPSGTMLDFRLSSDVKIAR